MNMAVRKKRFPARSPLMLFAFLFILFTSFDSTAETKMISVKGTIVSIADGDTVTLKTASDPKLKVRFVGIDTPETAQGYWGQKAKEKLAEMVNIGSFISVEIYGKDSYGRSLGRVFSGSVDVNLEMIRSGWAFFYRICDSSKCEIETGANQYEVAMRSACTIAEKQGAGNFDRAKPIPELPFIYRARTGKRELERWVGNVKTKRMVAPKEYLKVPVCDRVFFSKEADGVSKGYTKLRAR